MQPDRASNDVSVSLYTRVPAYDKLQPANDKQQPASGLVGYTSATRSGPGPGTVTAGRAVGPPGMRNAVSRPGDARSTSGPVQHTLAIDAPQRARAPR